MSLPRELAVSPLNFLADAHMQRAGIPLEAYDSLPAETISSLYPDVIVPELMTTRIYDELDIYGKPYVTDLLTNYSIIFQSPSSTESHKMLTLNFLKSLMASKKGQRKSYANQVESFILHLRKKSSSSYDEALAVHESLQTEVLLALVPFEKYVAFEDPSLQQTFVETTYPTLRNLLYVLGSDYLKSQRIQDERTKLLPHAIQVCKQVAQLAQ